MRGKKFGTAGRAVADRAASDRKCASVLCLTNREICLQKLSVRQPAEAKILLLSSSVATRAKFARLANRPLYYATVFVGDLY